MSEEFLKNSAKKDANDLSSVVQEGGHWCICAWAFAGAVERDSKNLEGLQLDCDRTNLKLVEVYVNNKGGSLSAPSGANYPVDPALDEVFKLCPQAKQSAEGAARGGDKGASEDKEASD